MYKWDAQVNSEGDSLPPSILAATKITLQNVTVKMIMECTKREREPEVLLGDIEMKTTDIIFIQVTSSLFLFLYFSLSISLSLLSLSLSLSLPPAHINNTSFLSSSSQGTDGDRFMVGAVGQFRVFDRLTRPSGWRTVCQVLRWGV